MITTGTGWAWFGDDSESIEDDQAVNDHDDIASVFGRCFCSHDGMRALEHLRSLTLNRALGPESSDALLRYVEGQRQLVTYILSLVERAQVSPSTADERALTGSVEHGE